MTLEIPEVVINRLPVYARALASLQSTGVRFTLARWTRAE